MFFSCQTRYGLAARSSLCGFPPKGLTAWRSHVVASDSLVDDRGCLSNRPESENFPCDVYLQRRRPLNPTLNECLGQRVFYILLQSPSQRPRPVIAVRTRLFEDPLARFGRQDHLHLAVNQRVVQLADK